MVAKNLSRDPSSHENCIECVIAGKNLKPLSNHNNLGKLPTVKEPNQEMELYFAGPLPLICETKNTYWYALTDFQNSLRLKNIQHIGKIYHKLS